MRSRAFQSESLGFSLILALFAASSLTGCVSYESMLEDNIKDKPPVMREYDEFDDVTHIMTKPLVVHEEGLNHVTMHAGQLCEGDTYCQSDAVVVMLMAYSSEGWEYLKCHSTRFIADGERIRVADDEVAHDGEVGYGGSVNETIMFAMPRKDFEKMAKAESVRGQLCNTEFTVSGEGRAAWKAMLDEEEAEAMNRAYRSDMKASR